MVRSSSQSGQSESKYAVDADWVGRVINFVIQLSHYGLSANSAKGPMDIQAFVYEFRSEQIWRIFICVNESLFAFLTGLYLFPSACGVKGRRAFYRERSLEKNRHMMLNLLQFYVNKLYFLYFNIPCWRKRCLMDIFSVFLRISFNLMRFATRISIFVLKINFICKVCMYIIKM